MKNTVPVTLVAFLVNIAHAVTPDCLLQAVNTQTDPGDLSAVCGNGAKEIQAYIAGNCGVFEESAQQAFVDICSSAGTSVAPYTPTTASTATPSASTTATKSMTLGASSSSPMSSVTHHITTTSDTFISSPTPGLSSASSTSSTAGANMKHRQGAITPMAAAAMALIGAVAAM